MLHPGDQHGIHLYGRLLGDHAIVQNIVITFLPFERVAGASSFPLTGYNSFAWDCGMRTGTVRNQLWIKPRLEASTGGCINVPVQGWHRDASHNIKNAQWFSEVAAKL